MRTYVFIIFITKTKLQIVFYWQRLPAPGSNVSVTKSVLVDGGIPEDGFWCIFVRNNGRLVFSPDYNPDLRVHCIVIEDGGEMHIGSESCPFDGDVDITLVGKNVW